MDNQIGKKPFGYIYVSFFPPTEKTPFERFYIGQRKFSEKNHYSFDPNYHGSGILVRYYKKAHPNIKINTFCLMYAYSQKELNVLEHYWVSFKLKSPEYPDSLNLCSGGKQSGISEESRAKISKALKGHIQSDKTKIKMSKTMAGRKLSEETKTKISKAGKGRKVSKETRKKMSRIITGHRHSEESRMKMSINHPRRRKVICLETKEVFRSTGAATEVYTNILPQSILRCCKKIQKSARGFHWAFLDNYLISKK
jgi:hypothetical protein